MKVIDLKVIHLKVKHWRSNYWRSYTSKSCNWRSYTRMSSTWRSNNWRSYTSRSCNWRSSTLEGDKRADLVRVQRFQQEDDWKRRMECFHIPVWTQAPCWTLCGRGDDLRLLQLKQSIQQQWYQVSHYHHHLCLLAGLWHPDSPFLSFCLLFISAHVPSRRLSLITILGLPSVLVSSILL